MKLLLSASPFFALDLQNTPLYELNQHRHYVVRSLPTLPDSANHMAALAWRENLPLSSVPISLHPDP